MNRVFRTAVIVSLVGRFSLGAEGGAWSEKREGASAIEATAVTSIDLARLADLVLAETNRVREAHGRSALRKSAKLVSVAEDQAAVMALTLRCSHYGLIEGKDGPAERVERAGLRPGFVAENVEMIPVRSLQGEAPAAFLVKVWMDSPGHRENLLNPNLQYIGCAIRIARLASGEDAFFAAQVFFRPERTVRLPVQR